MTKTEKLAEILIKAVLVLIGLLMILGLLWGSAWVRAHYYNQATGGEATPLEVMTTPHVVTE